jgi:succinate dehydrogenase / fumarate reductase cytochrome b subunit
MTPRPLLHKCFELSGVFPLGVYLVVHLGTYARALVGAESFGVPSGIDPMLQVLEITLLWLPLAFHVGYGFWRITAARTTDLRDRTRILLLRSSGIASLAFVIAHGAKYRLPLLRGERAAEDVRSMLEASLSSTVHGVPLMAALHVVGLGLVCVHFAIGLARFAENSGMLREHRARRAASVLALLLFATGTATIVHLATGSAFPHFQS